MSLTTSPDRAIREEPARPIGSHPLRIACVVPGFCANEHDWCIPVLRNFIEDMAARAEVVIYTPHYPFTRGTYRAFGATVHCFTQGSLRRGVGRLLLWREVLRAIERDHARRPFDLVHAFWATEIGFLATRAAARLNLPAIVSIGGGELAQLKKERYGGQLSPLTRALVERSFRGAEIITAGSAWVADLVPEAHRAKLMTVPLGVDTWMFRPSSARRGTRLLTAQTMGALKDYPTLLRAFARAAAVIPDLSLTIAGHGSRAELAPIEALIAELGIGGHVRLLGFVPHERMPEIYRTHDMLLHSSLYEAQGMVILEALATGMPVVSSRVGIAASLPNELVRTFVPRDVEGMIQAIMGSLAGDAHADAAFTHGPELIAREYSVERAAARFNESYARSMRRNAT